MSHTIHMYKSLCTHCGNSGHLKNQCKVLFEAFQKNVKFTKKEKTDTAKNLVRNKNSPNKRFSYLPLWARRNLIHPFIHIKGPKLIWVPKTNLWLVFRVKVRGKRPNWYTNSTCSKMVLKMVENFLSLFDFQNVDLVLEKNRKMKQTR